MNSSAAQWTKWDLDSSQRDHPQMHLTANSTRDRDQDQDHSQNPDRDREIEQDPEAEGASDVEVELLPDTRGLLCEFVPIMQHTRKVMQKTVNMLKNLSKRSDIGPEIVHILETAVEMLISHRPPITASLNRAKIRLGVADEQPIYGPKIAPPPHQAPAGQLVHQPVHLHHAINAHGQSRFHGHLYSHAQQHALPHPQAHPQAHSHSHAPPRHMGNVPQSLGLQLATQSHAHAQSTQSQPNYQNSSVPGHQRSQLYTSQSGHHHSPQSQIDTLSIHQAQSVHSKSLHPPPKPSNNHNRPAASSTGGYRGPVQQIKSHPQQHTTTAGSPPAFSTNRSSWPSSASTSHNLPQYSSSGHEVSESPSLRADQNISNHPKPLSTKVDLLQEANNSQPIVAEQISKALKATPLHASTSANISSSKSVSNYQENASLSTEMQRLKLQATDQQDANASLTLNHRRGPAEGSDDFDDLPEMKMHLGYEQFEYEGSAAHKPDHASWNYPSTSQPAPSREDPLRVPQVAPRQGQVADSRSQETDAPTTSSGADKSTLHQVVVILQAFCQRKFGDIVAYLVAESNWIQAGKLLVETSCPNGKPLELTPSTSKVYADLVAASVLPLLSHLSADEAHQLMQIIQTHIYGPRQPENANTVQAHIKPAKTMAPGLLSGSHPTDRHLKHTTTSQQTFQTQQQSHQYPFAPSNSSTNARPKQHTAQLNPQFGHPSAQYQSKISSGEGTSSELTSRQIQQQQQQRFFN